LIEKESGVRIQESGGDIVIVEDWSNGVMEYWSNGVMEWWSDEVYLLSL
jgi:hypothetical protein